MANMWTQAAQQGAQGAMYGGNYGGGQGYASYGQPNRANQGYNAGFYNPGFGMLSQGINTMNNLGSNIGNAFAQANAISSANMANQVPVEMEQMRQQGMMQRLQALSPLLSGIFGGMGSGGQPGNIKTNYGAGVTFGDGPKTLPNGMPDNGGIYAGGRPANVPSLGRQPLSRRY